MTISSIVLERKSNYTDHDRLFKELIQVFFQEFMQAFFPNEKEWINFSSVKFLEQEIFTDIIKGEKRQIDILAEVKLKGENNFILIHVEPQSYHQEEFHERMFIYCSRLYEKFRKPILPITVFSYEEEKEIPSKFTIDFPTMPIIEFNYFQIHLIKLDWKRYIKSNNPVAAALLSKMGYKEHERVKVKLEFLRMLSRMELNPAKMELIYGFFETYLKLNDKEEKQMNEEIAKLPKEEADRVFELPNSYRDEGMRLGRREGKREGRREGRKEGIELGKKQAVYNMLKKGLSDALIADLAGIEINEVKEMKKEL